jgi:hypothetical protein
MSDWWERRNPGPTQNLRIRRGRRKFRETKTKMFTAGEDHDNVCTLLRLTRPRFLLSVPGWDIFLITLNDKSVPVREDMRFEFRAEAFNVFNHANFSNPNSFFAPSRSDGRIWSDFVNDW